MATRAQQEKLLSVTCPWCKAAPGEECATNGPRNRRLPVLSLDGNAHEGRWQAALGTSARVTLPSRETPRAASPEAREPVSVGATLADARPW